MSALTWLLPSENSYQWNFLYLINTQIFGTKIGGKILKDFNTKFLNLYTIYVSDGFRKFANCNDNTYGNKLDCIH